MLDSIKTDVAVVGGGPAGFSAAVAAARVGADVLLIERNGFLGGVATTGLVITWPVNTGGADQHYGGIPEELVNALMKCDAIRKVTISDPGDDPHTWWLYDQEMLKYILDDIVRGAGVRLMLHSQLVGVDGRTEGSGSFRIKGITVANKSGQQRVEAGVYIDATGDGDLCWMAGCEYEKGRSEDSKLMPMTSCFRLGNVDFDLLEVETVRNLYQDAQTRGELKVPHHYMNINRVHPGMVQVFVTRIVGVDGTNVWDLTRAEIEGRDQIRNVYDFLRQKAPAFKNSFIVDSSAVVGVRDTRRILGDYVLTEDDVCSGRKFADGVASGSYRLDMHNPLGTGTVFRPLGEGVWYGIPYRCLTPRRAENVLVAGRAISGTWEALSSYRVMPICMLTGQAAGTAAGVCAQNRIPTRGMDVGALRSLLRSQGVQV
jgi:hypothetical protein